MTYPPGNPGYPPAQSPGSYGAPAATSFAKSEGSESNLKRSLTITTVVLGVLTYLASYGPVLKLVGPGGEELVGDGSSIIAFQFDFPIAIALFAGLLAGVSLLPKARNYHAVVAAVATLSALWLTEETLGAFGRGWALWLALALVIAQAGVAIGALLLDAGVISAPAPRPKYDQYYGQYGGYYGQQQQAPYQQSGYGTQYGGYPSNPNTGGFAAQPGPQPSSAASSHATPTPPTGFPSFSPPPSTGSSAPGQPGGTEHGGSAHGQHEFGSGQQPQAPSGPSQS